MRIQREEPRSSLTRAPRSPYRVHGPGTAYAAHVPGTLGRDPGAGCVLAAEGPAVRETDASRGSADGSPIARLSSAVDEVLSLDIDALGVPQVEEALRAVQPQIDRLHAHRSRLAAALAERAAAAKPAGGGDSRDRGERDVRDFLRNNLNLTHSEAKGALQTGRATRDGSQTGHAYTKGDLRPDQVSVITELLSGLDTELRDRLEDELLTAARELDAVALGRLGRRRVLELSPSDAIEREEAQHRRRAFRLAQAADGAVVPSGRLYGAQAEAALAAWHAFRRQDAHGEERTPDQRGADAFEQLCAVALRSGEAASRHGERPQLLVVADQRTLAEGEGVVEFGLTGPTSLRSVRMLLSDCALSRIGLDGAGVAIEVTRKVRTVPAGLWRILVARDRGCTWLGCDAPAGWCDVSHGDQAYADDGRLTQSGAALLCRRHHRLFDHGPYRRRMVGGVVGYERLSPAEAAEKQRRSSSQQGRGDPTKSSSGPPREADRSDPGSLQGQLGLDIARASSSEEDRSGADQHLPADAGERGPP